MVKLMNSLNGKKVSFKPSDYSNPPVAKAIILTLEHRQGQWLHAKQIASLSHTSVAETRRVLNSLYSRELIRRNTVRVSNKSEDQRDSKGRIKRGEEFFVMMYTLAV